MERIVHDNCLDYMVGMKDESIDLVITDPPYLINYKTSHRKDKDHKFCKTIEGDDNPELIKEYIRECYRILKPDTAMYMFCSAKQVDFFKQELELIFGEIKNMIIWVKNNHTAGDLVHAFARKYEIIFLVNKGNKELYGKRHTDIWTFDRVSGNDQLHQNQKPVNLIQRCVESHSRIGDIIFDGFAGSGTTAIAARNLKRGYICIEKDKEYYDIANKRLNYDTKSLLIY